MRERKKGINFTILSTISLVCFVTMFVFLVLHSRDIKRNYTSLQEALNTLIVCENTSQSIKDVSSYLTERAQLFIMTGNATYAKDYVVEKYQRKQREKDMEDLLEICPEDDPAYKRLEIAMGQSESLSAIELYAMRLAYESLSESAIEKMPQQLKQIEVREVDRRDDKQEQLLQAQNIMFDEGFLLYKNRVNENCVSIVTDIEESAKANLEKDSKLLQKQIVVLNISLTTLITLFTIYFLVLILDVLLPISAYVKSIRGKVRLNVMGAQELRYLADTYNDVHEYDTLTRIYNRRAFDEICQKSEKDKNPIGFMLVDLDDFKRINDTYGHAKGDYVLQEVAHQLHLAFGHDGDVARIGGDEFAVVFGNCLENRKDFIVNRFHRINEKLSALSGIDSVSLSSGIAFSKDGFSKKLYEDADAALYEIKKSGKREILVFKEK